MKIKFCIILYFNLLFTNNIIAQSGIYPAAVPGVAGKGNLSSCQREKEALFTNPAGLIELRLPVLQLTSQLPFLLPDIQKHAAGIGFSIGQAAWGFTLHRYGNEIYKEQAIELAYGMLLQEGMSIGIRGGFFQTAIKSYGQSFALTYSAGMQAFLSKKMLFGIFLQNPVWLLRRNYQQIHSAIYTGISYFVNDNTKIEVELSKEQGETYNTHLGITYRMQGSLRLLAGIQLRPFQYATGAGIDLSENWQLDMALEFNSFLGVSPGVGLNYLFVKK